MKGHPEYSGTEGVIKHISRDYTAYMITNCDLALLVDVDEVEIINEKSKA